MLFVLESKNHSPHSAPGVSIWSPSSASSSAAAVLPSVQKWWAGYGYFSKYGAMFSSGKLIRKRENRENVFLWKAGSTDHASYCSTPLISPVTGPRGPQSTHDQCNHLGRCQRSTLDYVATHLLYSGSHFREEQSGTVWPPLMLARFHLSTRDFSAILLIHFSTNDRYPPPAALTVLMSLSAYTPESFRSGPLYPQPEKVRQRKGWGEKIAEVDVAL